MQEIDSEEFSWWLAYAQVEPFPSEKAELGSAMISSVVANVNRDSKRKPEPFTLKDFMLDFGGDKEDKRKKQRAAVGKKFKQWIKQWQ